MFQHNTGEIWTGRIIGIPEQMNGTLNNQHLQW